MTPDPLPFEQEIHALEVRLAELEAAPDAPGAADELRQVRRELAAKKREVYANLKPWETVLVARHKDRPQTLDYIEMMFDEFVELHGDRAFGDDRAIRAGFARVDGMKVMLIGQHQLLHRSVYKIAHHAIHRAAITFDHDASLPGGDELRRDDEHVARVRLRELDRLGIRRDELHLLLRERRLVRVPRVREEDPEDRGQRGQAEDDPDLERPPAPAR